MLSVVLHTTRYQGHGVLSPFLYAVVMSLLSLCCRCVVVAAVVAVAVVVFRCTWYYCIRGTRDTVRQQYTAVRSACCGGCRCVGVGVIVARVGVVGCGRRCYCCVR